MGGRANYLRCAGTVNDAAASMQMGSRPCWLTAHRFFASNYSNLVFSFPNQLAKAFAAVCATATEMPLDAAGHKAAGRILTR
jgi:hypothetical protein